MATCHWQDQINLRRAIACLLKEAREAKSGLTQANNRSSVTPLLDVFRDVAQPVCRKKEVEKIKDES